MVNLKSVCETVPEEFYISEFAVYQALRKLKVSRASLNDVVTNRLLRTLADVFAAPICAVINSTIRQGVIPEQWRLSRISVIPKVLPVMNLENDIRPIAITCPIAKVAEQYVHFKVFQ